MTTSPPHDAPTRLNADNTRYTPCKVGSVSCHVWIFDEDFPLGKGDVVRYTRKENGRTTRGRVLADPEARYLFIGVDETTPLLEDSRS